MPPAAPANFRAIAYPAKNILFYWDIAFGVGSYNLYRRPFGVGTWTLINPTPIIPAKLNYPLMPVDILPPGVASVDPFYYGWCTLDQEQSSDWVVTAVNGGESPHSEIIIWFPKPTQDVQSDRQPNSLAQMQKWVPETQRFVNWDAKVTLEASHIEIGDVGLLNVAGEHINPATEEGQQDIVTAIESDFPSVVAYDEENSVPSLGTATILTYTVPSGQKLYFRSVRVSGNNYAIYHVKFGAAQVGKIRTHDGSLEGALTFDTTTTRDGPVLAAGVVVAVSVYNSRPWVGDFECTLFGKLVPI